MWDDAWGYRAGTSSHCTRLAVDYSTGEAWLLPPPISQVSPFSNPYLLVAMFVSFGLHFVILYVPVLASTFGIVPLSVEEWKLVLLLSFPVIILDEVGTSPPPPSAPTLP